MELMTKEIAAKMPALYSSEDTSVEHKEVIVKYFTPDANWTWYVIEGEEEEDGDWTFFGLVEGFEKELGYFMLSELQNVRGVMGMPVERDLYFEGKVPV